MYCRDDSSRSPHLTLSPKPTTFNHTPQLLPHTLNFGNPKVRLWKFQVCFSLRVGCRVGGGGGTGVAIWGGPQKLFMGLAGPFFGVFLWPFLGAPEVLLLPLECCLFFCFMPFASGACGGLFWISCLVWTGKHRGLRKLSISALWAWKEIHRNCRFRSFQHLSGTGNLDHACQERVGPLETGPRPKSRALQAFRSPLP